MGHMWTERCARTPAPRGKRALTEISKTTTTIDLRRTGSYSLNRSVILGACFICPALGCRLWWSISVGLERIWADSYLKYQINCQPLQYLPDTWIKHVGSRQFMQDANANANSPAEPTVWKIKIFHFHLSLRVLNWQMSPWYQRKFSRLFICQTTKQVSYAVMNSNKC